MDYAEYMQSERWKQKRAKRFEIDGYQCVLCGSAKNLECHHLSYDRLGHEDVRYDLLTLCRECHREIHSGTGRYWGKCWWSDGLLYAFEDFSGSVYVLDV